MLRKIQRRFVLAAMAAFGTVMFLIAAGINWANYIQTTSRQDRLAMSLLDGRGSHGGPHRAMPPGKGGPPDRGGNQNEELFRNLPGELAGAGPEAEFTTRFFTVVFEPSGEVREIFRDYISSIDNETAESYGRIVFSKNKDRGYYGDFRYVVRREEGETAVLFLNSSMELQFMRSLFLVSFAIGVLSLFLVFLLVMFFSRYAVQPYMKNMERQKRFITDAGHELKTPITSIATSADIAAMEHEGDEWIANIQKQAGRLAKLAGELVALSRLDEETPFPEKSRFSLSDAAWETAEPFKALAEARGRHYSQSIEDGVEFYGDRDSIQKVISILLDNGVRYSDEGGEIRLDVYRKRGKVWIEVFNTCDLPDKTDLNRLFDRFYRMDKSRSAHTGGTGIGLSMAQAIAEAYGGRITVKSPSGKSICFKVGL